MRNWNDFVTAVRWGLVHDPYDAVSVWESWFKNEFPEHDETSLVDLIIEFYGNDDLFNEHVADTWIVRLLAPVAWILLRLTWITYGWKFVFQRLKDWHGHLFHFSRITTSVNFFFDKLSW